MDLQGPGAGMIQTGYRIAMLVSSQTECTPGFPRFALQVKTFLGGGWGRLVPPVPVTQCGEQKDGRQPG